MLKMQIFASISYIFNRPVQYGTVSHMGPVSPILFLEFQAYVSICFAIGQSK